MRTTLTKKLATLGVVGVAVAGLLTRAVKGIVSFVQNLLPSPTQKEGVRPVPKAFRLGAIFQTAGIGTIYGLLFAGLLLMPFQSHRAIAASPVTSQTYETPDGAVPQGSGLLINIVGGLIVVAIVAGVNLAKKKYNIPKGKVVAVADLVKHSHYLSEVAWSHGDKQDERTIQYPHYADVDYSYYYIHVTEIVWDAEEGEFRQKGMWHWYGTGYAAYSLDHYNNASYTRERSVSNEFTSSGYHIILGHTEDVNLTHAFDSDVDEDSRDDHLAADSRSPRYYKPEATAWLSKMRHRGSGHFTYTKLDKPLEVTKTISAIRDVYKRVDIVPKHRRLDRARIRFNRSTLSWKLEEQTKPKGSMETWRTPSGTIINRRLPKFEVVDIPVPHQEIEDF